MKIRFTLIMLTAFAALMLSAETIKFRSGYVLAAELSTAKISVSGVLRDAPLTIPQNPVYAVVSVKLDSGRSISIFDYTLDAFGHEAPCVAIRTGKNFLFTTDTITSSNVITLVTLAGASLAWASFSYKIVPVAVSIRTAPATTAFTNKKISI